MIAHLEMRDFPLQLLHRVSLPHDFQTYLLACEHLLGYSLDCSIYNAELTFADLFDKFIVGIFL